MKFFHEFNLLIITTYFRIIGCNCIRKFIQTKDFYQITTFVPINLTNTEILDQKVSFLHEFPSSMYSFCENRRTIYNFYFVDFIKIYWSLQQSLVTFYTNNLSEVNSLVDFLVPHLSVRQRPKFLTTHLTKNFRTEEEVGIVGILKYAWENKFLDFTLTVTSVIYYFNPFNDIVYRKELKDEDIEIFPDKLKNVYEYKLYTCQLLFQNKTTFIRRRNRKVKTVLNSITVINFAARILNIEVVTRNVIYDQLMRSDFLDKWDLDFHPQFFLGVQYWTHFSIPTDQSSKDVVAFVPIVPIPKYDIFIGISYDLIIVFVISSVILIVMNHYSNKVGTIGLYNFVLLLLGQSARIESKRTTHKIIFLTILVASVKISNDFLINILKIQFEKQEMPFQTHEDLYKSQLLIITDVSYLPMLANKFNKSSYLRKILDETVVISNIDNCLLKMQKWKNASCITLPYDIEFTISLYRNPDGSDAMKAAKFPIYERPPGFYWFARGSPYAMKFQKIFQKIIEGNLMQWAILMDKNRVVLDVEESKVTLDESINKEQLLITLSFGCLFSATTFAFELVVFTFRKLKVLH